MSVGRLSNINWRSALKPISDLRGFTLIELIVVMLIAGLMMSLVTPRLVGSLTKTTLKTSAQKICSSLRYARSQAISERIIHHAVFDFEKNGLFIKTEQSQDHEYAFFGTEIESNDDEDPNESEPKIESYFFPEAVKMEKAMTSSEEFDSGSFSILFYPAGNSSGGSVVLIDEKERRFKISVDFITGMISLTEPHE